MFRVLVLAPPLVASGMAVAGAAERVVGWARLQESLERTCCKDGTPDRYSPRWLNRQGCASVYGESNDSELDAIVDAAAEQITAEGLHFAITPDWGLERSDGRELAWPEEASRDFARAFLRSESFRRIVLRRVYAGLKEAGIRCGDCPGLPESPLLRVDEETLMRYVAVFAWPGKVRAGLDENGDPTGEGKYSIYLCAGINGLRSIPDADDRLGRAAGAIAFRVRERLMEVATAHLNGLRETDEFRRLSEAGEDRFARETEFLRAELPRRVAADPRLLPAVQRAVSELSRDLAVGLE